MTAHAPTDTAATRALAVSLLDEALMLLGAPVALVTATKHPLVWDAVTIRAALQAFAQRTGRLPGPREWRLGTAYGLPARATVVRVYGSLAAAYAASGLAAPESRQGRRTR